MIFEKTNAPVGLIGALDIEVRQIVAAMADCREARISSTSFYTGKLGGVPCVVAKCGVGKVNAAVCTQTMLLRYSPKCIINLGVAGGIGRDVKIGDLVVASACVQYDFDTTAFGDALGLLPIGEETMVEIPCSGELAGFLADKAKAVYGNAHIGVVATGDRFVADPEACRQLRKQFGAIACEMEGGSIAQVCRLSNVPVAVLRAVSDNADDTGTVDFTEFAKASAKKNQKLLAEILPGL